MASCPLSLMFSGVWKSGSPTLKSLISLPSALSRAASADTAIAGRLDNALTRFASFMRTPRSRRIVPLGPDPSLWHHESGRVYSELRGVVKPGQTANAVGKCEEGYPCTRGISVGCALYLKRTGCLRVGVRPSTVWIPAPVYHPTVLSRG